MDTELQIVTREKLVADMRIVLADTEQLLKAVVGQSGEKLAALQTISELLHPRFATVLLEVRKDLQQHGPTP